MCAFAYFMYVLVRVYGRMLTCFCGGGGGCKQFSALIVNKFIFTLLYIKRVVYIISYGNECFI